MSSCKFSLLLGVLNFVSQLRPLATSECLGLTCRNKTWSTSENHLSNSSSNDSFYYEEIDFDKTPEVNETLDTEWIISVNNGTLVLRQARTLTGMNKSSTAPEKLPPEDSDDMYYIEKAETSTDSLKSIKPINVTANELLPDNATFRSVPEVFLALGVGQPCKSDGDQPQGVSCDDRQGRKRRPFHGFFPFLRECRGRRRPLRCRRYRRRRRRRTTPRPSALLANFTFINQVNNQGYLTMSNVSNLNSSSRE